MKDGEFPLAKEREIRNSLLPIRKIGSRAVDGKRFLESNASSIPGTYFRLGYFMVPRIKEAYKEPFTVNCP